MGYRPFITLADDHPIYERLVDMTMEQKAALPTRFHVPAWSESTPGLFICSVCWDEGAMTPWPCAAVSKVGWALFDPPRGG
jgi:hypothetical protein